MQRIAIAERANWRAEADQLGFQFHTINGAPYWVESAYYQFTLRQIEDDIELPAQALHELAMDLVDDVVRDSECLTRLNIPEQYWDWIARSWQARQAHLYGRIDLAYTGEGPAKLLEFNYDTPTSLYEAASFQWLWLEQIIARGDLPPHADQFNAIQERLVDAFSGLKNSVQQPLYFASMKDHLEDRGTVLYLRDCALQAGIATEIIDIEDIGLSTAGYFTDLNDRMIASMFKLYPLEFLFRERFGSALPNSKIQLFEPPWKAILSNKAILPMLWARHPNHPNLLEAHFEEGSRQVGVEGFTKAKMRAPLSPGWVRKPIHSREGANVELMTEDGAVAVQDGPYGDAGSILQRYTPLPRFGDYHAIIGAWVIADQVAGMGMREDTGLITRDSARFVPHVILE
jgi:glutathionylspermidine synthase